MCDEVGDVGAPPAHGGGRRVDVDVGMGDQTGEFLGGRDRMAGIAGPCEHERRTSDGGDGLTIGELRPRRSAQGGGEAVWIPGAQPGGVTGVVVRVVEQGIGWIDQRPGGDHRLDTACLDDIRTLRVEGGLIGA